MRNAAGQKLYRFWGRKPPESPQDGMPPPSRCEITAATEGKAKMYLYGPIDSWGGPWGVSAVEVATALNTLPAGTTELELHINSPGGEVYEGIAIMNLLRDHDARVIAIVDAIAASAASFIACSADETVMGQNSELMIHDAWGIAIGNAKEMHDYADYLGRTSDNIASVYAKKAGGQVSEWRDYMLEETWFSAEEAVSSGLAERVAGEADGEPATDAAAARLRYDTEALFEHASRAQAPAPAPVPAAPAQDAPVPAASTTDSGDTVDATGVSRAFSVRHRLNARRIASSGHHATVVLTKEGTDAT